MSVQAALAIFNNTEAVPPSPSKRPNLPPMTKTALTNWTSKKNTASQPTRINPPTAEPSPVTMKPTRASRSTFDMLIEELTALYQELLEKHNTATTTISKLESEAEVYACDITKVRDYEIRVEYLAQKLEQVSEERDSLEEELATYKNRSLITPVSPTFGPDVFGKAIQNTPTQQIIEETYFDDILDAYEERQSNDDIQQSYHDQLEQMRIEYDQGMKMAMESYVADLEKQRLENKTLQSMVKKQDQLISKLESRFNNDQHQQHTATDQDLLHHQVELQQIELESKRDLLTQLLNERDDLMNKQRKSPFFRSSIDVLAELARAEPPRSPGSLGSPHQGRNTPPPFAPPKTPLPPVPNNDSSITTATTPTRNSLISYSRSSTSSTSWPLDEQQQQQQQQQQQYPLSTITTTLDPKRPPIEDDHTTFTSLADTNTNEFFWKGLKKKL